MNKYVVKNNTKKEYKNIFVKTDYDIPMFGFKSALFILMTTMLSLLICINILNYLKIDFRIPNALISDIVCGFIVAYSQFFIDRKKGVCKNFWIVGTIFSLIAFMVIFMIK